MRKRGRLTTLTLVTVCAVMLLSLLVWPTPLQRNMGNVAYSHALTAADDAAKLAQAQRAIALLQRRPDDPVAQARLLRAYELKWQAAGALGLVPEALEAYTAIHAAPAAGQAPPLCAPDFGRFEAEMFGGLAPGTTRVVREVDERPVAYLFSTSPITKTICLPETALYRVGVNGREAEPRPIEVAVALNEWTAAVVSFEQGDGTWSEQWANLVAPAGTYVLSISLANDVADASTGLDRNAAIDYVVIEAEDDRSE